ncbi:MAG: GntG family PLP-dependent aldolase [Bacteroidia bacterium]|jgi:threonine aldolase
MHTIDLRSDTVTKPTPAMLDAMKQARVGDDVYGEDPEVNRLQEMAAKLFGMEAGLFCPSGTMTNQIAIKMHTQPGDELICADNAHVFKYEGGGIASNSGVQARVIQGDRGRINAFQVEEMINGDDVHFPRTSLVCLENTSNRGGGSIYDWESMQAIRNVCDAHQLKLHLDGARIFNALVEGNYTPLQLGKLFDSISICLSKGLGAPVGSVLLGTKTMIQKARRIRKVFGGGMRQAGYLAAAGSYALTHYIDRLKIDHDHAKRIGKVLQDLPGVAEVIPVETNIIIFRLSSAAITDSFKQYLESNSILCGRVAPDALRFVFHLDIHAEMVNQLESILNASTAAQSTG